MKNSLAKKYSAPAEPAKINLQEIVRQCFLENSGDAQQAAQSLQQKAIKDTNLFICIMESGLPGACWNLIRQYCRKERRVITTTISQERSGQERVQRLADSNASSLFNMKLPIPGCPKLGDADKEQVSQAAQFYLSQAYDMENKGKWLSKIADMMKINNGSVKKQLTEEKIAEFFPG